MKTLEVTHHALHILGGDHTVEKNLDHGEISSFGTYVAGVVNLLASNSSTYMVQYFLLGQ